MGRHPTKKIVLLGDTGVGKTSICLNYINNELGNYTEPTIGAAFYSVLVETGQDLYKLDIWDTAGQEKYRALTTMYYRYASVVIVVYDIGSMGSFENAKKWIHEVRQMVKPEPAIILVGNKCDLITDNHMIKVEISDYINLDENKNKLWHMYASSMTGYNVAEIFKLAGAKGRYTSATNGGAFNKRKYISINNHIPNFINNHCC
jgi:Ras-related protein Rab-5C